MESLSYPTIFEYEVLSATLIVVAYWLAITLPTTAPTVRAAVRPVRMPHFATFAFLAIFFSLLVVI